MNMEVKGTVTAILKNNIAKIMIERKSACGGNCHDSLNSCQGKSEIFVKHSESLKIGDEVLVSERSKKVLLISTLVFMLPLICMVIIYTLCSYYIKSEVIISLASLLGGILIFLIVVLYFRKLKMPVCRKVNA